MPTGSAHTWRGGHPDPPRGPGNERILSVYGVRRATPVSSFVICCQKNHPQLEVTDIHSIPDMAPQRPYGVPVYGTAARSGQDAGRRSEPSRHNSRLEKRQCSPRGLGSGRSLRSRPRVTKGVAPALIRQAACVGGSNEAHLSTPTPRPTRPSSAQSRSRDHHRGHPK